MSSESAERTAVEQTKQQIRGLVDEISALSKQDLEPQEYYTQFLTKVVEALAAVGGVVWSLGKSNQLEMVYQINLSRSALDQQGEHQQRHARLLGKVVETGEGMLVPPHSGGGDENEGANPTEMLLVIAPVGDSSRPEMIIEIFQRPTSQPATRRGYLRFLTQMCEVAGEWLKSRKLRVFSDKESQWARVDSFAQKVHDSLDVRLTSYTVANEAQRLIGCDRVSVAIMRGRKCKVEAVSGQDTFDSRSNVVTLLGELATKVVSTGESLWYSGSTEGFSPQIEDAIHEYVDHSHSKTVAVLPLEHTSIDDSMQADPDKDQPKDPTIIGALIIEQIEDVRSQEILKPRVDLVWSHSARALTNALDHSSLFLMPLWKAIGHSKWLVRGRTLPKTVMVVAALVIAIVSLCVVPADFNLKGDGVVQPVVRRDIFVRVDGDVTEVAVEHGQTVKQGQLLVRLKSEDLEVRIEDVDRQLRGAKQTLSALNRTQATTSLSSREREEIAGKINEAEVQISSFASQLKVLSQKEEQLSIRSPIDGQVVTWNLKRNLQGRPVAAGQVLMTVIDPDGPWELEVFMAENRMGHIVDYQQQIREESPQSNLKVDYVVATTPDENHQGSVKEIVRTAELHEEHGHSVQILVKIDRDDLSSPRPGATVIAKIYCGRHAVGYVWLHDVSEWIQKTLFQLF